MGKPNTLSRRSDHGDRTSDNDNLTLLKPDFFTVCAVEALEVEGMEKDILEGIHRGNKLGKQEEPVAWAAKELQRSPNRSVYLVEWSEKDRLLLFRGKVYVSNIPDLRRHIMSACHDTLITGHPRRWKTLELVSRSYWWPQLSHYVGRYVGACDLCLWTKPLRSPPNGELYLLPVLAERWDMVSVDFIVELPESADYDVVMTVVDSVSKVAHFVLTHTMVMAEGAVQLFLHQV